MATLENTPFRVYVWELPVRLWHWVMALCLLVLGITGYWIGTPPSTLSGEASEHYQLGYIRFAHFAAAYVFTVAFLLRLVWSMLGNPYSRELFGVPRAMLRAPWWAGLFGQMRYYLFLKREPRAWKGHNPLAAAGMFFMYVLGAVFMILTGFALYGEGLGQDSWAFAAFSWVLRLFGSSQNVHTVHHLGMWYLVCFTLIHVYMVVREDIMSDETVVSAMVSGWRIAKR
ncbi:MAG: Ni/Fe-hydrogenase, b-type cytochrome subunit [Caldimonas sp.]